jgi:multiple sugar transport system substrate-binding protein
VKKDLFDVLLKESKQNGRYVVMPMFTNVEILLYRKDLFEDPQEAAAFKSAYGYDLSVPKDWKTFTDAARHFTRNGLYGTDVKGAVETEWLAHVLQAGSPGVVLDDAGKVIINNKQHLEALTFYADLYNKYGVSPAGVAQVDWAAAQNLFNQGQTAMMRFWSHAYPGIPKDSPVYGKVGTAPMIGGSAGVAGIPGPWYLMVPEKAANKTAAMQFAQFIYDNNDLMAESDIHLAARKSTFETFSKKPGYEHYAAVYDTLQASSTRTRPATPKWQQIVDTILIPTLQKSLAPGADYKAILDDAATKVSQVVAG